jgi:hypothetical protein
MWAAIDPNVRRYVPLPQLRGGMRFCTRVGVLNFSFRYKIVVVCKNHDTKVGDPAVAGQPTPSCRNLSWWLQSCPGVEGNGIYRPVVPSLS